MSALPSRIIARVDTDTQELLSRAAASAGMSSINSFVLSAAIEKARSILSQEVSLKLSQRDAMALASALDEPAKSHPRLKQAVLKQAVKSYKNVIAK